MYGGITYINERDGTRKPQCFLCGKILWNGSMNPAKLKSTSLLSISKNASKDAFFFIRRKLNSKRLGHFQDLDFSYHKSLFLKHPIKFLTGLPNRRSPTLLERL
jgi:hypothetical protein